MKTKNIVIAFVILVLLIGAYYMTVKKKTVNDIDQVFVKMINDKYKEKDVTKLSFFIGNKPDVVVVAERKEDKWVIKSRFSAGANSGAIDRIVKDLMSVDGELRSDSEKVFREYCIEDGNAVHFQIEFSDGVKEEILCGKKGPDRSNAFARKKGENKVYLINKNLLSSIHIYDHILSAKIDVPGFVDLKVFKEKLDVSKVVFFDKEQKFNIFKADKKWNCVFPTGIELDEKKAENWISSLSHLSGKDVVDPKKLAEYGLLNSDLYLEIGVMKKEKKKVPKKIDPSTVQTGEAKTPQFEEIEVVNEVLVKLLFGKKGDTYYMKTEKGQIVYSLSEEGFRKTFITAETLKKEEKKDPPKIPGK
ncbi:DUF4340 domain-containing protein [bacterium]|nr:DUF4340 domain-containing protein [bacterium]